VEEPAFDRGTTASLLGAVFDTNSRGRYDLLVYDDGILAIRGNYRNAALAAARGGTLGGPGFGLGPSQPPSLYIPRILGPLIDLSRDQLLARDESHNFFTPTASITAVQLTKHWYAHSLTLTTSLGPDGRRYSWKPAFNHWPYVKELLHRALPTLTPPS
jgi:hypothetical protein